MKEANNELSEEILLKLQHLPQRWENIKQSAAVAKQQVATLQANEVAAVRKKMSAFDMKQLNFREEFLCLQFFKYVVMNASFSSIRYFTFR